MRTLAETSLSDDERALLERFVVRLRNRWGARLHGVWLFGSRARGEPPTHEDSDVDVLVLVEEEDWRERDAAYDDLAAAAGELGLGGAWTSFSVHVDTPEWLEGRREIRSFFIAEVDRDKVVVDGRP